MFKLRELIHSRRPAAAAALLLFTALLFYAGARMLPAIADETSWEDSKFGPLDGMEESVYSQTISGQLFERREETAGHTGAQRIYN